MQSPACAKVGVLTVDEPHAIRCSSDVPGPSNYYSDINRGHLSVELESPGLVGEVDVAALCRNTDAPDTVGSNEHSLLPHVIFINLNHRVDRCLAIAAQLMAAGWPSHRVHRLPATLNKSHGDVGCADSHLRALQLASASGWSDVLVLEDDITFHNATAARHAVLAWLAWTHSMHHSWTVVLLSGIRRDLQFEAFFTAPICNASSASPPRLTPPLMRHVRNTQTAAAYLVSREYLPTLAGNIGEAASELRAHPELHATHSVDQHWKVLQETDEWLRFDPFLASQAPGYSDITHRQADHAFAFRAYEIVRRATEAGKPAPPTIWVPQMDKYGGGVTEA